MWSLVALLIAFDVFDGSKERPAEYYALVLFGAMGMCLMTSAVELLLVFVSLEISSIATYILAAIRKRTGKSPEAGLKYFLLGSFATAFFLYGIALTFGATGTTNIAEIAAALPQSPTPGLRLVGCGHDSDRPRLQSFCRALPGLDSRCLRRCSFAGGGLDVHWSQGGRLRRAVAHPLRRLSAIPRALAAAHLDHGCPLHDGGQPGCACASTT